MSHFGRVGLIIIVALALQIIAPTNANADDYEFYWPLPSVDRMVSLFSQYLSPNYAGARFSDATRDGKSVLIMKLGMGVPYCKGHAVTIAVRKGRSFRAVAVARTLRGVRSRNIGLTAAKLKSGTYHIVHGTCHVRSRVYNVGLPAGRDAGQKRFSTSYAKFTIEDGQVLNAGFLRFFPPYRGRGRPKILLQAMPRKDLKFLARRYSNLRDELDSRLMRRTTASGEVWGAKRKRKRRNKVRAKSPKVSLRQKKSAPTRTVQPKRRVTIKKRVLPRKRRTVSDFGLPPVIKRPKPAPVAIVPKAKVHPLLLKPLAKPKVSKRDPDAATKRAAIAEDKQTGLVNKLRFAKTSMSIEKRREACKALLQLKREGKVQQLPLTCLHVGLPGLKGRKSSNGLPVASGNDK